MKTDFEVMAEMAKGNKDLQVATLHNNLIGVQMKKNHAVITIGVPLDVAQRVSQDKYVGGLYLMNREEFFKARGE